MDDLLKKMDAYARREFRLGCAFGFIVGMVVGAVLAWWQT